MRDPMQPRTALDDVRNRFGALIDPLEGLKRSNSPLVKAKKAPSFDAAITAEPSEDGSGLRYRFAEGLMTFNLPS